MKLWRHSILALVAVLGLGLVARADDQPHMKTAHHHCWVAKILLQEAEDNKGWHKVDAIAAIDEAMKQIHEGVAFDNKHTGPNEDKKGEESAKAEAGKVKPDNQPRMHEAHKQLEEAVKELKEATEDKGGHRKAALEKVEEALKDVREGVKFADANKK
jgi:hypothetical protein